MKLSRITDVDGATWEVEIVHVCWGLYEFRANGKSGGYLRRNTRAEGNMPGWADDQGEILGFNIKDALPLWREQMEKQLQRGRLIALYY